MLRSLWLNTILFVQGALLSYVALFTWLRPVTYLASKVMMPLAQILFFSFLGMYATSSNDATYYVIGNAVQLAAVSGIFGVTLSVGGERWSGTLIYIFGTPANRLAIFVGRAFFHVIDGILGVFIGFAWGVLLLGLDLSHTDGWGLLLAVLITTFSTSGLGLLLGCVSLVSLDTMFVNNTAYFLLLVFSGANVPIANLPPWMQAISWGLPLTRGIAAARALIAGSPLAEVAPLLAGEAVLGVVYVFLGYVLFRWFEFQARRRGTLEAF